MLKLKGAKYSVVETGTAATFKPFKGISYKDPCFFLKLSRHI